jgi:hypothetical protein
MTTLSCIMLLRWDRRLAAKDLLCCHTICICSTSLRSTSFYVLYSFNTIFFMLISSFLGILTYQMYGQFSGAHTLACGIDKDTKKRPLFDSYD